MKNIKHIAKFKKLYNGQPYAHSLYLPLTFYYKKKIISLSIFSPNYPSIRLSHFLDTIPKVYCRHLYMSLSTLACILLPRLQYLFSLDENFIYNSTQSLKCITIHPYNPNLSQEKNHSISPHVLLRYFCYSSLSFIPTHSE